MSSLVIAIDGPAGAGKSTVAQRLARKLGLRYLDTGAMYRCAALVARRHGLDGGGGEPTAKLLESMAIAFQPGEPQRVLLDGEDVTEAIRAPEIGDLASALSVSPPLRRLLVRRQKQIVAEGRCTLEGRDVTTVVAPDAQVKVFMTASIEERARRRHLQLQSSGIASDIDAIKRQIAERDERDRTRTDSPLRIAPEALVVDTDGKTIDEVVEAILDLVPSP